jgi:putative ABC transport system substrate-binding protein
LIGLVCGGAIAWTIDANAQAVARPARIGLVPIGSPTNPNDQALVNAFREGLREVGLVETKDVTIDIVWVRHEAEFPQVMKELVERGVKILMPAGTSASVAAKRETSSIPIVFLTVGDPIGIGIVESLARPGGNATGFSDVLLDLSSKFVDFARKLATSPAAAID